MSEKSVAGIAKLYSSHTYTTLAFYLLLSLAFIHLLYISRRNLLKVAAFYSMVSISFDYSPHVLVALHHICSGNNNSRVFPGLTTTQVCIN